MFPFRFQWFRQSLSFASRKDLKVMYSTGQITASKCNNPTQEEKNLRESSTLLCSPLHWSDGDHRVQRGEGTCARSHSEAAELGLAPRLRPPRHWSCFRPGWQVGGGWLGRGKRCLVYNPGKQSLSWWPCGDELSRSVSAP